MSGPALTDIAIGVVLMFLVVSLFCTILQEWIAQIFGWRSKHLEASVKNLFDDSRKSESGNAPAQAASVLNHPLVQMLTTKNSTLAASYSQKPNYIPARNFALALVDTLKPARDDDGKITLQGLREAVETLKKGGPKENTALYEALQPILAAVDKNVGEALVGIEDWFDFAMDRASGWYARQVRWVLLVLGLTLAVLTNADTVQVAMRLSADNDLRDTVAALAQARVGVAPQTDADTPAADANGGSAAQAKGASPGPDEQPAAAGGTASTDNATGATAGTTSELALAAAQIDKELRKLQDSIATDLTNGNLLSGFGSLPVGWSVCGTAEFDVQSCYPGNVSQPTAWAYKIIGLVRTALAASLGAPFWFGLLQQLNAARSSGPKPKSSTAGTDS